MQVNSVTELMSVSLCGARVEVEEGEKTGKGGEEEDDEKRTGNNIEEEEVGRRW